MTPEAIRAALVSAHYVADDDLASVLWLAQTLERPLLIEGDAGVGKTSVATGWAQAAGRRLVRLQCYEGLDLEHAAYEWNYSRQLLEIRLRETGGGSGADLFGREFLLERPLLAALASPQPALLVIDEIDRADEAFEAFLLEVLSEYQLTIPELGTVRAAAVPYCVQTSNGTRELSDALRRRCLYHYLDYPDPAREVAIVRDCLRDAHERLVAQAVAFVQRLRKEDLQKNPGVAETLDWIAALRRLNLTDLPDDPAALLPTLACVLKTRADRWQVTADTVRKLTAATHGVAVPLKAG
ncbi:MAG: MoxR family ATPase [Burkholderiales bacterium]|jgi:MoxR-like ATPase|nr:MoxR family ATPase [Burkholderiales bacterium]